MSYQRFKKGGRVAKSPFLAKSVQKLLNKKIKTDFFFKNQPFLNRRLLIADCSETVHFLEKLRPLYYIKRPIPLLMSQVIGI